MIETIAAIVGFITGIGGLIVAWRTSRASAKKDEVDALCAIIETLRDEVDRWQGMYNELAEKYEQLERMHDALCQFVRKLGYDPDTKKKDSKLI